MVTPFNPRGVTVGFIDEGATFGVTPSTPTLQLIPFQSIGLKQVTETVTSRIIRSSRATPELLRNGISAEANINTEFMAVAYDDFMEASLLSADWTAQVQYVAADIAIISGLLNRVSNGWLTDGFKINEWIHLSGFTGDAVADSGFYKITAITEDDITTSPALPNDDASTETVTVTQGPYIEDGSTFRSFSFEEALTDVVTTDVYKKATGISFDTFGMTIDVDQPITVQFGMIGKSLAADTSPMASVRTAASTNNVMQATSDVDHLRRKSTHSNQEFLGFDFNTANAMAIRKLVGTLGAAKPHFFDEFTMSGNVRIYVEDVDMLADYLNFTLTNLVGTVRDTAGNAYVIEFPSVKYSDMEDDVEGGSDMILTLPWTAQDSASEGVAMRIARFTSVP